MIAFESGRIGQELDKQAALDREWLPEPHAENAQGFPAWTPYYDAAAVAELCEAEQAHHACGAAELALKDAIQSLEVLLLRYSERFGDPAQLWRLTSPDYQYTQELFAPCIAALKAARKFNEARGEPTAELVKQAREKLNPEVHRQAAEQNKEAEQATRFCSNFLNWISKYEGETDANQR